MQSVYGCMHSDPVIWPFCILRKAVVSWVLEHLCWSPSILKEDKSPFDPKRSSDTIPLFTRSTLIATPSLPPLTSSKTSVFRLIDPTKQVVWVSIKSLRFGVLSTIWPFFRTETELPGSFFARTGVRWIQYCLSNEKMKSLNPEN